MFLKFFEDLINGFHITLAGIFSINQNVIKVHNDKNVKFFYHNFVDIAIEADGDIRKTKKFDLILKIAVLNSKDYFLLVIFPNSYIMIYVCHI